MCFWGFCISLFLFFLLSGWQAGGLDSRVERHSLCPVLTSLDFKWPTGRSAFHITPPAFPITHSYTHSYSQGHRIPPHFTLSRTRTRTVQISIHMLSFLVLSAQTKIYCII